MQAIVTSYTESYVDTKPYYRSTFIPARTYSRTATGSGVGSEIGGTSGPTQLRLGAVTDFSFPYLNGGRFYLSAPISQQAATGSGSSSAVAAAFVTRAKQATGSGVGSEASVGLRIVGRTATGSAVGDQVTVTSGPTQLRLSAVTDFSFPYLTGGRFYLGPAYYLRTASDSGLGSESSTFIRGLVRSATGTGFAGESTSTDLEILFRQATGFGTSTEEADPFLLLIRQATGFGTGTSSVAFKRIHIRSSFGGGLGTDTAVRLVKNIRTASNSGVGSQTANGRLVAIRTASASGEGTASSTTMEILYRGAVGSGTGYTEQNAVGYKFHMFRPPTRFDGPTQLVGGDRIANRLARFYRPRERGRNVYKLIDESFTEVDQANYDVVLKVYHGGHVHTLTEEEYAELLAAGYAAYLT